MEFWSTFLVAFVVVAVLFNTLFLIALRMRDNSIVDVAWGAGFILVAFSTLLYSGTMEPRQLLVVLLVLVWGLRLAIRIYRRNRGKGEDFRYKKWREDWGDRWRINAYIRVFLTQGVWMLLVTIPITFVNAYPGPALGWLDAVGAAVWLVGFYFEAVGDSQLDTFIRGKPPRGSVLDTGLWRYTRHPNYFGEVTQWWGVYVIVLSVPLGWATFVGPMAITATILFYSGIPLLEKTMMQNPAYVEYAKRTSVFFPVPPRQKSA